MFSLDHWKKLYIKTDELIQIILFWILLHAVIIWGHAIWFIVVPLQWGDIFFTTLTQQVISTHLKLELLTAIRVRISFNQEPLQEYSYSGSSLSMDDININRKNPVWIANPFFTLAVIVAYLLKLFICDFQLVSSHFKRFYMDFVQCTYQFTRDL